MKSGKVELGLLGEGGGGRGDEWRRSRQSPSQTRGRCEAARPADLLPGPLPDHPGKCTEDPSITHRRLLSFLPSSTARAQKCASVMETSCWVQRTVAVLRALCRDKRKQACVQGHTHAHAHPGHGASHPPPCPCALVDAWDTQEGTLPRSRITLPI